MSEPRTFCCSICGDPSTEICVYCTKDSCSNHLCRKCLRCSDCCECDVPLEAAKEQPAEAQTEQPAAAPAPVPEPQAPPQEA